MIKIIQRRKIWFSLSIIMVVISIASLATWGLKFGIDFTGGTLMEVGFNQTTLSHDEIKDALKDLDLGDINIQSSSQNTTFLKFKSVDETTHQSILSALEKKAEEKTGTNTAAPTDASADASQATPAGQSPVQVDAQTADGSSIDVNATTDTGETITTPSAAEKKYVSEKSFESIGPVVGNELKTSAIWAVAAAILGIIIYIAWAFRKVSYPVSSFKYGIVAATALAHDALTTVGVFSILGHYMNVEIGISFVAALLTIIGYSNHDTIVVFDRIRENLFKYRTGDFEDTVNRCVNETLARSINTSFTVILTLTALFLFGGASIHYFVLALLVGITFGTYSSIFIASPLLVTWQKYDQRKKKA